MFDHARAARRMVEEYVIPRGITDRRVIEAMMSVPRHLFVEEAFRGQAYGDHALPIGEGQSISRPYIVARMTEALGLTGDERVLEIGGGSAYQSAILSRLVREVYTVERLGTLAAKARKVLVTLRCNNVLFKIDDGTLGWRDKAPFDAILVAAAAPELPHQLLAQLRDGGRIVIPIGGKSEQRLKRYRKVGDGFVEDDLGPCTFVPLIGEQGWKENIPDA